MRLSRYSRSWAPAAVFAMTAGLLFAFAPTPARAQTRLDLTQVSEFRTTLAGAIAAAKGNRELITQAISKSVVDELLHAGCNTAGAVASVVIAVAEENGVPGDAIGAGLAQAADRIAAADQFAAQAGLHACTGAPAAIATAVANEGNGAEVSAFQTASRSFGHPELADLAASGTGANGGGIRYSGGMAGLPAGAAGGGGKACLHPSCCSY
jgi:hypothetical protein